MRQLIFRILAGILSLVFGIFLSIGDTSQMSLNIYANTWIITIVFGLFAICGTRIAESFLANIFGMEVVHKSQGHSGVGEPPISSQAPNEGKIR